MIDWNSAAVGRHLRIPNSLPSVWDEDFAERASALTGSARSYRYMHDDPCVYCGGDGGTWDHLDAAVRHKHLRLTGNAARACRACNRAKRHKTILQYLWERATGRIWYASRGPDPEQGG